MPALPKVPNSISPISNCHLGMITLELLDSYMIAFNSISPQRAVQRPHHHHARVYGSERRQRGHAYRPTEPCRKHEAEADAERQSVTVASHVLLFFCSPHALRNTHQAARPNGCCKGQHVEYTHQFYIDTHTSSSQREEGRRGLRRACSSRVVVAE